MKMAFLLTFMLFHVSSHAFFQYNDENQQWKKGHESKSVRTESLNESLFSMICSQIKVQLNDLIKSQHLLNLKLIRREDYQ